jgi:hypothetical protein
MSFLKLIWEIVTGIVCTIIVGLAFFILWILQKIIDLIVALVDFVEKWLYPRVRFFLAFFWFLFIKIPFETIKYLTIAFYEVHFEKSRKWRWVFHDMGRIVSAWVERHNPEERKRKQDEELKKKNKDPSDKEDKKKS